MLEQALKSFKGLRLGVVGDAMLDKYLFGDAERVSPEAPVLVLRAQQERQTPGGAANVAANVVAAGAQAVLFTVIGQDEAGQQLMDITRERGVETDMIHDPSRRTTVKTRVIARNQQVIRIDHETRNPISQAVARQLLERIRARKLHGLIIEDYNKGVVSPWLISELLRIRPGGFVAADPKIAHFDLFKGVDLFKPNRNEFSASFGCQEDLEGCVIRAARQMGIRCFLLTLGSEGALLRFEKGLFRIPAFKHEVFDITGAGDTVIAYATLSMVSGIEPTDAALIASLAAGIKVGKLGAATVSWEEVMARAQDFHHMRGQIRRLA